MLGSVNEILEHCRIRPWSVPWDLEMTEGIPNLRHAPLAEQRKWKMGVRPGQPGLQFVADPQFGSLPPLDTMLLHLLVECGRVGRKTELQTSEVSSIGAAWGDSWQGERMVIPSTEQIVDWVDSMLRPVS